MSVISTLLSEQQNSPLQPSEVDSLLGMVTPRGLAWSKLTTAEKEAWLRECWLDVLATPWNAPALTGEFQSIRGVRLPTDVAYGGTNWPWFVHCDSAVSGSGGVISVQSNQLIYTTFYWPHGVLVGGSVCVYHYAVPEHFQCARIVAHDENAGSLTLADVEFDIGVVGKQLLITFRLPQPLKYGFAIQAAEKARGAGQAERINEEHKAGARTTLAQHWHVDAWPLIQPYVSKTVSIYRG